MLIWAGQFIHDNFRPPVIRKTERHNDLTGEKFPFSFDQPLIINLVYEWSFLPKWTVGAKWRYQSGAPFTPVIGTFTNATRRLRPSYGKLGSERLPDYHRLDLRISREFLQHVEDGGLPGYHQRLRVRERVGGHLYKADFTSRKPVHQFPFIPAFRIWAEF